MGIWKTYDMGIKGESYETIKRYAKEGANEI